MNAATFGLAEHLRQEAERRERQASLKEREIAGLNAKVNELTISEAKAHQTIRNLEIEIQSLRQQLAEAQSRP